MKPNPPPRDIKYDADKVTSDAQNYLDKFKMLMKDVVEDVFGDLYVFCQIFHDLTKGWIIGYCKKSDFFDTAVFYKAGQPAINNKDFIYKGDSYTIRNSELIQINKK